MSVEITIQNQTGKKLPFPTVRLRTLLGRVLKEQKIWHGQWTLALLTDSAMAALHARTMNIPTSTDVLTFNLCDELAGDTSNVARASCPWFLAHPFRPKCGPDARATKRPPVFLKPHSRQKAIFLDTAICLDEARRQCLLRGIPILHEVLLYAVHSLLHIRGYDDISSSNAARMHRREDNILVRLNMGPVYSKAAGPTRLRLKQSRDR